MFHVSRFPIGTRETMAANKTPISPYRVARFGVMC